MLLVLLALLSLYCVYKKQYRYNKIINFAVVIWALITVIILIFKPADINTCTTEERLNPIENDLDSTDTYYLIIDDDKIYYKTNKIREINFNDSIIINYESIQPKIVKYYKQNSTFWYLLTLNKKSNLIKTEFYIF